MAEPGLRNRNRSPRSASVTGLYTSAFQGVLALFLLEMGLVAADTLRNLRWQHARLV